MIRPAQKQDRPVLEALYQTCFSESKEYTTFAFERLFPYADVPVAEVDGAPRSMCFLLPFLFRFGERAVPAQYLYAACTQEEYRGQGLMGEILRAADQWCRRSGRAFTFLVPAQESLFHYYASHGYQTVFTRAQVSPGTPQGSLAGTCTPETIRLLEERYLASDGCLVHSGWSMAFTAEDAERTGGVLRKLCLPHGDGCAVQYGGLVKELCCDRRDCTAAAALLYTLGARQIYTSPFLWDGPETPYAMAKTSDGVNLPFSKGYCNLLFD